MHSRLPLVVAAVARAIVIVSIYHAYVITKLTRSYLIGIRIWNGAYKAL